jgi:aldehyde dehydrogenase family 7 protein A1
VVERLTKAYSQLKVGDPLDNDTLYGPLHSQQSVNLYLKAIEEVKNLGIILALGFDSLPLPSN